MPCDPDVMHWILPRLLPRPSLCLSLCLSPVALSLSLLHARQCIFAIVAFATVVDYSGSKVNYVMFTGISTLILTFCFVLCYLFNAESSQTFRTIELAINLLWEIFWFVAAVVSSTYTGISNSSDLGASCAFSWLTFIVWTVSCVMSWRAHRGKVSMPAAPQAAV